MYKLNRMYDEREREGESARIGVFGWCLFHILFAGFFVRFNSNTYRFPLMCIGDSEYYCERSMPIVRWCWCACLQVCVCLCNNIISGMEHFVYVHFGACMCVCRGDSNVSNVVLSFIRQPTTVWEYQHRNCDL